MTATMMMACTTASTLSRTLPQMVRGLAGRYRTFFWKSSLPMTPSLRRQDGRVRRRYRIDPGAHSTRATIQEAQARGAR
jgi:hypothetical protein